MSQIVKHLKDRLGNIIYPYTRDFAVLDESGNSILNRLPPMPNLLDNPWFTINQRKATTYAEGNYGVDRWKLISGTASVTANGIELNGTLRQIREHTIGKPTTASVKMYSGTATATYDDTTKYFDIVSSGGVVRAAKLEMGTVSTLEKDYTPDYAQELAKCQRYYQYFGNTSVTYTVGVATKYSNTRFSWGFPLCQVMRTTPSVVITTAGSTGFHFISGGKTLTGQDISAVSNPAGNHWLGLYVDVSSTIPENYCWTVRIQHKKLEFIADL